MGGIPEQAAVCKDDALSSSPIFDINFCRAAGIYGSEAKLKSDDG